jgi:hypothetical protein
VWAGDVGWNTWEEIDRVTEPHSSVKNFGWPCYEGSGRQSGYDAANLNICENLYGSSGAVSAPFYAYNHNAQVVSGETCPTGGSSPAGLAFYPAATDGGGPYPDGYDGALFFADYSRQCIWAMRAGSDGNPDPSKLETFAAGAAAPVDLEIGPNGDLFYADYSGGTIRQISYGVPGGGGTTCAAGEYKAEYFAGTMTPGTTPTYQACEASINHDWATGGPGNGVGVDNFAARWTGKQTFEGGSYTFSTTTDDGVRLYVDGELLIDKWINQSATTHTATKQMTAGEHEVKVEYYENGGNAVAKASWQGGSSSAGPTATISSPASTLKWKVGDLITFSGSAKDSQGNALPASALSWSTFMHHCSSDNTSCHEHELQKFQGVASGSFNAPDHEYPSYLEIRLTTTNSSGSDTESVRLDPETVALAFRSVPTGINLTVGSSSAKTPFNRTVIVGSKNTISAPLKQKIKGKTYTFASWSDGGAQSHDITAPATATTYTANYGQR